MSTPEQLYTPKDVARVRELLYNAQEGIDPILKEPFEIKGACLDHDHLTQHVRAVLHRQCNAFEGKVFNAWVRCLKWLSDKPLPEILRNLADFYEQDYSHNPLHPAWLKRAITDFNTLSEGSKRAVLRSMNLPEGGNSTERKKAFQKALLTRKWTFTEVQNLIALSKVQN